MQAHEILYVARNDDDARARAVACKHSVTYISAEVLGTEDPASLYEFEDASVLAIHGNGANAFSSAEEADAAFRGFTDEEIEADLPKLFAEYGDNYKSERGTEYLDGYELGYWFGVDSDGRAAERRTVRYYY